MPANPSTHGEIIPNISAGTMDDSAWVEVIHSMENIYAELVEHQVELENKNAALEESQHFISSVLSAMNDVLIVCDMRGEIQECNSALLTITGQQAGDLIGRSFSELFPADRHDELQTLFHRDEQPAKQPLEVHILDHAGQQVPLLLSCTPRVGKYNRQVGRVVTGHPIGELQRAYSELNQAHEALKDAQLQLIQSEKMASLGRLVAGVAHELNNPISFVVGNVHVLQRYEKSLRQYLNAVHKNADPVQLSELRQSLQIDDLVSDMQPLIEGSLEGAERVAEIIQNLRNFAAPGPRQQRQFDIVALVSNAVHWVTRSHRNKPAIHLDFPADLPLVNSEGHVHQIIINLLQNSMDAMENAPVSAEIWVKIARDNGRALVEIRDNGPGIAEEDLIKVFDPFFTTKPVGKGTGLGLSISYGLATAQCGGNLSACNSEEHGAVFSLHLPLDDGGANND